MVSCVGCSSFNTLASYTQIKEEDGYYKIVNAEAGIETVTFHDFKFATNRSSFKKLNANRPVFNNILVYGRTVDEPYEYYLLYNPKSASNAAYMSKDTLVGGKRFVLAISKEAPAEDRKFLFDRMFQYITD